MKRQPNLLKGLLVGALAGLVGAWLKSKVEPPLQTLTEHIWPVTRQQHTWTGTDPKGHQDNMPPAAMLDAAEEKLAGHHLARDQKLRGQQVIHYTLGVTLGAAYGALAEYAPGITRGFGMPAGVVMYSLTHGSAVPATGFQRWPWQLPVAAVAWESGSHVVFAAGLEGVRRALRPLLR